MKKKHSKADKHISLDDYLFKDARPVMCYDFHLLRVVTLTIIGLSCLFQ